MYCTKCGKQINVGVRFCANCGNSTRMEAKNTVKYVTVKTSLYMLLLSLVFAVVLLVTLFLPLVSSYSKYGDGDLEAEANMPKYLVWATMEKCSFSYWDYGILNDFPNVPKDAVEAMGGNYWNGNGIMQYLYNYSKLSDYEYTGFSESLVVAAIVLGTLALMVWIVEIISILVFDFEILMHKRFNFSTIKQIIRCNIIYAVFFLIHITLISSMVDKASSAHFLIANYGGLWKPFVLLFFLVAVYFLYFKNLEDGETD